MFEDKIITKKIQYEGILKLLSEKYPFLLSKVDVAQILGMSRNTLDVKIREGKIKATDGKISIGTVAKYLCGE